MKKFNKICENILLDDIKVKDLKEWIKDMPDNYNIVISKYQKMDEEHTMVEDIPAMVIAINKESKELRFVIESNLGIIEEVEGVNNVRTNNIR